MWLRAIGGWLEYQGLEAGCDHTAKTAAPRRDFTWLYAQFGLDADTLKFVIESGQFCRTASFRLLRGFVLIWRVLPVVPLRFCR